MTVREDAAAFARLARMIERERETARPIVAGLRRAIDEVWDRDVPAQWRTLGFVEELLATSRGTLDEDPAASVALAQLGLVVVTTIPRDAYPRPLALQLEIAVWKELATARRFRSEYDSALRALDAADRRLDEAPALGHDRAIVQLTRAIVLREMNRLDEAASLLAASEPIFAEYGDDRLLAQCCFLGGTIDHCRGQFASAITAYERAIDALHDMDDLHTLAGAYCNLGQAQTALGRPHDAAIALQHALGILEGLGMTAEVVRTRWSLGNLLLATSQYARAATMLLAARDGFLSVGLPEEAGLAGLDVAEAWIALGKFAEAQALVERVRSEFERAHLNLRALTALSYLRDMTNTRRAAKAVQHVRRYLEELRREPLQLFCPLGNDEP